MPEGVLNPTAVDDAILYRFTGQTDVRDPHVAQARVDACRQHLAAANAQLRRARREKLYRVVRLVPVQVRAEPWVVALVLASLAALGASLLAYFVFALSQVLVLALMPVVFAAVGGAVLWLLWDRDGETPQTRGQVRRSLLIEARSRVARIAQEAKLRAQEAAQAAALLDGIRQAIAFPLNRLLSARCDLMDGTEFEIYLAEIFALLGYSVERMGGSGDQGVDLILTRGPHRIAVQAKCYSNPLGNGPVQEVFTGSRIHGCHRWAVVTNSTFTPGGREAAAKTGTILIEGSQLPALIRGQIMF
jgi:restriction system protein